MYHGQARIRKLIIAGEAISSSPAKASQRTAAWKGVIVRRGSNDSIGGTDETRIVSSVRLMMEGGTKNRGASIAPRREERKPSQRRAEEPCFRPLQTDVKGLAPYPPESMVKRGASTISTSSIPFSIFR